MQCRDGSVYLSAILIWRIYRRCLTLFVPVNYCTFFLCTSVCFSFSRKVYMLCLVVLWVRINWYYYYTVQLVNIFNQYKHELVITCSAVALSRVLKTALGNMETSTPHSSETSQVIAMKLRTFDNVRETNTCAEFGDNPLSRGRSTHTWNIHLLWLLPAFLPALLLFFLRNRIEIISRTKTKKTQFGVRKYPPSKYFSLIWRFGGHFAQNPHNVLPSSREIPAK